MGLTVTSRLTSLLFSVITSHMATQTFYI